jgi:hypothetical protein
MRLVPIVNRDPGDEHQPRTIREITHLNPAATMPAPMTDLPWMRRERIDGNLRRVVHELRQLVKEDQRWDTQYEAMADACEGALLLVNAIEDYTTNATGFSVKA